MRAQVLVILSTTVVVTMAACPSKGFMESVDLTKFMGVWYQYTNFGTLAIPGTIRCLASNYELGPDGKTIKIVNSFILKGLNNFVKSKWTATASDAKNPTGKMALELKLPGAYGNMPLVGKTSVPFMVVDTDYDTFAVLIACKNFVINQFEVGYILTRKRGLEGEELSSVLKRVDDALAKVGVSRDKFKVVDQQGCDKGWFTVDMASVGKAVETAAMVAKYAPLLAVVG